MFWLSSSTLHLFTDASRSLGYGAVFDSHWFFGKWPARWIGQNIIVLEMFPIVISLPFGRRNFLINVLCFTNNLGLVEVITTKTTKDKNLLVLLRALVLQCLKYNILFKAIHIPGLLNVKADALSRLQVTKFKSLGQGMDPEPAVVPTHLLPVSWPL